MEVLIFGLIIMAVSAFFNKGKKDAADDEGPVSPAPTRKTTGGDSRSGQQTYKRVEDYAKEMYGELQNQKTQQPARTQQVKKKVEETVNRKPVREARQEVQRRVTSRGAKSEIDDQIAATESEVLRGRPAAPQVKQNKDDFLPLSGEDFRRGIIMAEILLPPKSKR